VHALDDSQGTVPLPGDELLDDELHCEAMQDETVLQQLAREAERREMESAKNDRRRKTVQLPDEVGMGTVLQNAGLTQQPALPALRRHGTLRTVLEGLGPELVQAQCSAIERFKKIADGAEKDQNAVMELLATKAGALYQHKLLELIVGRTVNVNATIKSQRDLPKLDKLSPEKRAQLAQLVDEMSDVVEGQILDEGTDEISPGRI
jgi:hypothetical protein